MTENKVIHSNLPFFCASMNFELEYFLNEEIEGSLTDTMMNLQDWRLTWQSPNLTKLKPNVKVGQSL